MLFLEIRVGESVTMINTVEGSELGKIVRIKPHRTNGNKLLLGFDFPQSIQIVRGSLMAGKEPQDECERC